MKPFNFDHYRKMLGKSCRKWREDNKISLKNLSKYSEYTYQVLQLFEEGRTNSTNMVTLYIDNGFSVINFNNNYRRRYEKNEEESNYEFTPVM